MLVERERNAQNQTSQLTWTGAKTKQVKLPLQWRLRRRWWSLAERMEIFNRSDIVTQQARLLTIRSLGGMNTKVTHCHFLWMMGYWHRFICGGNIVCTGTSYSIRWRCATHDMYLFGHSYVLKRFHSLRIFFGLFNTVRLFTYLRMYVPARRHAYPQKAKPICYSRTELWNCALVPSLFSYHRFLSRHYRFFLLCRRRRHFRLSWSWCHFRPSIVPVSGSNVQRSLSLCFGFTNFR